MIWGRMRGRGRAEGKEGGRRREGEEKGRERAGEGAETLLWDSVLLPLNLSLVDLIGTSCLPS